jgi:hypothetical protein
LSERQTGRVDVRSIDGGRREVYRDQRDSQWISTTKSLRIAQERYGQHGVVAIDLSRVGSDVVDASAGIPGMPSSCMLSRWAANAQEVLIRGGVPREAIVGHFPAGP